MDRILLDTLVTGLPMVPAFMGIYVVLRIRQDFETYRCSPLSSSAGGLARDARSSPCSVSAAPETDPLVGIRLTPTAGLDGSEGTITPR